MEQEGNKIRLKSRGAVILLEIEGDFTSFSEPFINEVYEDVKKQGANAMLLIFEKNAYINSGGIAVLIQFLSKTKKNNQKVGITGLSDHFKKIFKMVGITKIAKLYDTAESAQEEMA